MNRERAIMTLELELLSYNARHDVTRIDQLLADDFFECGKTGTMFGKRECLERLPTEKEKKLVAKNMSAHLISENI